MAELRHPTVYREEEEEAEEASGGRFFLFGSDWQRTYEQLNNLEFICMTDMHRYTAR